MPKGGRLAARSSLFPGSKEKQKGECLTLPFAFRDNSALIFNMTQNILVIGGNRFFGRHLISSLIEKGHKPVLFNRQNIHDGFGSQVERIKGDRDDQKQIQEIAQSKKWDVVFDQVCFTATQAKHACSIFENQVGRYIVTSTMSVYKYGVNLKEDSFYPQNHEYKKIVNEQNDYGEAKRQMESVFYKQAQFPVTAVRFPIVLGIDDYTKRLVWHFERLREGKGVFFPNVEAKMSFVDSSDAGRSLAKLMNIDWKFPINICSPEAISIKELLAMIEKQVGKNFKLDKVAAPDSASPFGIENDWYMNVDQMKTLRIVTQPLMKWLPQLISKL